MGSQAGLKADLGFRLWQNAQESALCLIIHTTNTEVGMGISQHDAFEDAYQAFICRVTMKISPKKSSEDYNCFLTSSQAQNL